MKEKLYTIPLMDAFRAEDECPFCYIERDLEQHALDFVLGPEASYMQEDVRMETNKMGFCREHYKKMYLYGNRLGSALILETHLRKILSDLKGEMKNWSDTGKQGLFQRLHKDASSEHKDNVSRWIHEQEESCYICAHIKNNYDRYMATFFELFRRNNTEFAELLKNGKGFCLPHFADVLDYAPIYLNKKEQQSLREILFPQMQENLSRIIDDVEWLEKKFDYRFKDAEWKNAQDSVQRAMQKLKGGYPADLPYQQK